MPGRVENGQHGDSSVAIRQIVASTSDNDFMDHLIEAMRNVDGHELYGTLDRFSSDRDDDIERMCTSNHQEFVDSVQKLDHGRNECAALGNEIMNLVTSYQQSTSDLADQKKALVGSRSIRQNINESGEALKECLEALRLSNQVHELVAKQNHYAALRALDELQTLLRLRDSLGYNIGDLIEKSIPATQTMIADAVMNDLNTWLFRLREISQYIGELTFFHTEQRRARQRERASKDSYLGTFKLNSAIELVADEMEEYDVLNSEEAELHVDFTPLFECIHIHEALGQGERFRSEYASTRRKQKERIIPSTLKINDDEASDLKTLLENIAGFSIVERATMRRTENLRTSSDVDELWDSMSQSAINLMSGAVQNLENAETLLKITGVISFFIQTMESWGFYAATLNSFLMTLFERYTSLAMKKCSDDFQEIVSTDDYMPYAIDDLEVYDKIMSVVWYDSDKEREEIEFPYVLPFSQMYPMVCIDIRNFLHEVYTAPDDYLTRSSAIDERVRASLDELLTNKLCKPLIEKLSARNPGQIVQILTNLEHFERACQELELQLAQARTARSKTGPVHLSATTEFRKARTKARQRIFEHVNSKIDDLAEAAEYEWMSDVENEEPSSYIVELTRYMSNMMNSVLLNLPSEIKDMIYFEALNHAADSILQLPLDPSVTLISPATLHLLNLDVQHLATFSASIPNAPENLSRTTLELSQTVSLMASSDPEEFFDIDKRKGKYNAVNAQTGAMLLEKVEKGKEAASGVKNPQTPVASDSQSVHQPEKPKASERFGMYVRGLRRAAEGGHSGNSRGSDG